MTMMERLSRGEYVIGPFLKLSDPSIVEISALAGFDFVIIDLEHGPISFETAQNLIRAAELRGITPVVRIAKNEPELILRALDIGAAGVQVPQISTSKDAEQAVKAGKFHPEGERGVCRFVRAAEYSAMEKNKYFAGANKKTFSVLHIEGIEGIENLPEILEVEGIDIIFLGPYDLSQSCGVPGEIDHPDVTEKMRYAVELAGSCGTVVGTFVENAESALRWHDIGVGYISYSVDVGIYYEACKIAVDGIRGAVRR